MMMMTHEFCIDLTPDRSINCWVTLVLLYFCFFMFLPYHKTVLVLVLGIDLGHLEVLVLVLGIDLGHLEVLVLVLGIDLGHLEVLVLVLGIDLSHLEVLVLVLTSRDLVLLTSGLYSSMTLCFEHNLILAFAHLEKKCQHPQIDCVCGNFLCDM